MLEMKNVIVDSIHNIMYDVPYLPKRLLNSKVLTVKNLVPEKINSLRMTYGSYDYLENIDKEKYQIFVLHGSARTYHGKKRIQKKWRKRYHYIQFLLVDKEEFNSLGLDFDGDTCTIAYKEESNGI